MPIKAPWLPLDKLRGIAGKFLADYHVTGALPVPIDRIADKGFGMNIVPIPGMQGAFEIESAISSDLSEIYVDEWVFRKRYFRYRFSVAHELSHRIVHGDIFQQLEFTNLAEWKNVVASIPLDQYTLIERQAYWLAGLILVPEEPLTRAYLEAEKSAAAAGISLRDTDADWMRPICANIGKNVFHVSADVILRRLKEDRLWP
ncbi:MAG: ImmA/IrrE family metallo-endopeptidase [Planctomycetia bacterium]|nr:ImmA/IrrE family metallo-endopeptidase [Planctomycetia bacterium]